jgi:hypothetical protein
MSKRFRHEDVSAVPSGWKVRTVRHSDHRVRVAFPPGRKQTGSGRLVSILHPAGENGCTMRSSNPAELMVIGANPPRRMSNLPKAKVETYTLVSKITGKPIRKATRVVFADGRKVDFIERLPKARAIRAAMDYLGTNPAELLVMAANPRVEVVHGDNPPVEEIAEEFSGVDAEFVDVYNEPHMPRGRYAQLGELLNLHIKPAAGGQVQKITFSTGSEAPIVVCDSSARQIYFVNGNQDISAALASFGPRERGDGKVELGLGRRIDYKARKEHVAEPDEDKWKHSHGEENGVLPMVLFDTRNKKLLYEGGDYRIEGPWIHN